jgi:hypothetical protein
MLNLVIWLIIYLLIYFINILFLRIHLIVQLPKKY